MNTKVTSGNRAASLQPLHGNFHSQTPSAPDEPWRTKKFIAAHYGICARTIERAVKYDDMPCRRCRGRILFRISAIDQWLTITLKYQAARRGGHRSKTAHLC
jgi:hypothetical protein